MEAFRVHAGITIPFDYINVDTDQIIPKQFLKRIQRTGFGVTWIMEARIVKTQVMKPQIPTLSSTGVATLMLVS